MELLFHIHFQKTVSLSSKICISAATTGAKLRPQAKAEQKQAFNSVLLFRRNERKKKGRNKTKLQNGKFLKKGIVFASETAEVKMMKKHSVWWQHQVQDSFLTWTIAMISTVFHFLAIATFDFTQIQN